MEKKEDKKMIFVHADLDLYGLDPYEFRIYGHIGRRGQCFSSQDKIASICNMSVRKVQYSLKSLESKGLIQKKERKGRTAIYELTPRSNWKSPEEKEELEKERDKVKTNSSETLPLPIGINSII